jgi:hypothetical protein
MHWYEPVLVALFIWGLFYINVKKQKVLWVSYFLLIAFGLLSVIIIAPSIGRGIEGFRFTLLALMIFLPAYLLAGEAYYKKLIKVYLIAAAIVAIWGLVEYFFLPIKYWINWGILPTDSSIGFGVHTVVGRAQAASLIGGPNQLATYLLPAFFIALWSIFSTKSTIQTIIKIILMLLFGLVIGLTLSRSAIVGAAIGLAITPLFLYKNFWGRILSIAVLLIVAITSVVVILANKNNDLVTHGGSQVQHYVAMQGGWQEFSHRASDDTIKLIFGGGLGSAGPIVLKYQDGFIPESWYIQLALELGVLGLAAWLLFNIYVLAILFKMSNYGLALGLLSVSIAAVFLHTWADNPAVAFSIILFVGAYMGIARKNGENIN